MDAQISFLIVLAEIRVAYAQLFQVARRERLDNEVGGLDQLFKYLASFGFFDIEGDAFFIGVIGEPVKAFFGVGLAAPEPPDIARGVAARLFDFNHVDAQVGEYLPAEEAFIVGQVQARVGGLTFSLFFHPSFP